MTLKSVELQTGITLRPKNEDAVMKLQKKTVLSVAIAAASVMVAPLALSFDTINWNWDADVQSTVTTDATSNIEVNPTGLAQTENDQETYGSLDAVSAVTGVDNLVIALLDGNPVEDLASVESVAAAVGNNAAITADVSMQTDSSQTFAGVDVSLDPLNVGALLPGSILAASSVIGVTNTTVDSSATGVANNLSIDLDTMSDQDSFAITNSDQLAVALVSTISTVDGALYEGFNGMGTTDSPTVSSAATSLGNNLSITVGSNF